MVAQLEQWYEKDVGDGPSVSQDTKVNGHRGDGHAVRYLDEDDFGPGGAVGGKRALMSELETEIVATWGSPMLAWWTAGGVEESIVDVSVDVIEAESDPFEEVHDVNPYCDASVDVGVGNMIERGEVLGWTREDKKSDVVSRGCPEYKLLRDVFPGLPRGRLVPRKQWKLLEEEVGRALSTLSENEGGVLRHSYGLGGEGEATPKRVGRRLDLNVKQVLETRGLALRKLQHPIRSDRLRQFIEHR